MKCKDCRGQIRKWRTERLSGNTCDCGSSQTIDQYPCDLQTRELRREIMKKQDTSKFGEMDWMEAENKQEQKQNENYN